MTWGTSSESCVLLLRLGDGSHVDKMDGSFVVMDKVGCGDGVDGDGVAAAIAAATAAHWKARAAFLLLFPSINFAVRCVTLWHDGEAAAILGATAAACMRGVCN